ncbi:MAG: Coenzyme F420 hydrogenase/dehydrogenase, beta subunit C-terminal domain [Thermoguttaceae bacterium]|nr:Coenzyme F420 hydrogenase/dehydrogenase, beta subunit C-terminal domain [Thermoguttaceae bacterium]
MKNPPIDEIVSPEKCSGCGMCRNLCPQNAIRMETDRDGFLSPAIDPKLCVGCRLCLARCPQRRAPELARAEKPEAYACWNLDDAQRAASSSGGMFTVYARQIFARGGVVFGAGYDERLKVRFAAARSAEELKPLLCSKYVQADTREIYREVKGGLETGRPVLFVGTPCQVAALYAFLDGDPPNLYTCDFLCHGVPSPRFYRKWLGHLERVFKTSVRSVNMRSKLCERNVMGIELRLSSSPDRALQYAWHDRGMEYLGRAFLKNYSLRKRCYTCSHVGFPRPGDVTLADFWKLGDLGTDNPEKKKGISLNLINSEKGKRLLEMSAADARFIRRELSEAVDGNSSLRGNTSEPPLRDEFVRDTVRYDYETLVKKYHRQLFGTRLSRLKVKIKKRLRPLVNLLRGRE